MSSAEVVAELARLKPAPASLLVYLDGAADARRVAIPNVRKRWSRVAAMLGQMSWVVVEACDKSGAIVGTWRCDEDGAAVAPAAGAGLTIREREIADVVLASFKQAHAMFLGMFGSLLGAVRTQMEATTATNKHLTASYDKLLLVQRETLELQHRRVDELDAGDDGDGDAFGKLARVVETLAARESAVAAPGPAPGPRVKDGTPRPRKTTER